MVEPAQPDAALAIIKNLTIVQTAVMGVAGFLVALVLRGYYTGKWVQKGDDDKKRISERVEEAHRRMDTAGREMSELASTIQGLEGRFRRIFVSKELFDQMESFNARDRADIRKDIDNVWAAITRIGQERRK